MKFTTAGTRRTFTLMPTRMPTDFAGVIRRDVPGLSVSSDNTRIIDTDRERGWTHEEKMAMERYLMSCSEFGTKRIVDRGEQRGDELLNSQVWELWFAPSQDIPAEHLDFCKEQNWYKAWDLANASPTPAPASGRPCLHTITDGSSVMKCAAEAIGETSYCETHQEAPVGASV